MKKDNVRAIIPCLVLIFAISWTAWGTMWYLDLAPGADLLSTGLWLIGGSGPTIGAAIFLGKKGGIGGVKRLFKTLTRWRVSVKWYLFVLGIPVLISLMAIVVGITLGWTRFNALEFSES